MKRTISILLLISVQLTSFSRIYSGTVDEQFTNYVVPQENGNKTDARWASLTNYNG